MIKNYEHSNVITRIYEDEDFDFSSIRLLGRDVAKIAKDKTLKKIKEILNKETNYKISTKLIEDINNQQDDLDKIVKILEKLNQGIFDI